MLAWITPIADPDRRQHATEPLGRAALIAVGAAYVFCGPVGVQEAGAAEGTPLRRST